MITSIQNVWVCNRAGGKCNDCVAEGSVDRVFHETPGMPGPHNECPEARPYVIMPFEEWQRKGAVAYALQVEVARLSAALKAAELREAARG